MLNKENYVPWSSRLLRYAKSRPNRKLIHNFIINGSYVRRIIPEPGDTNRDVPANETFYIQTDDELTEKELKQIEDDDQAIQTILLGLPEDIYAAVDSCETAQEIWLRVQQMMKGSDIEIQEKKANQNGVDMLPLFIRQRTCTQLITLNYITDLTTSMNMALALMAKAFKLNYSTPTNNNQRISSNPCNRQIAQPGNGNQNGNGNLVAARAEGNAAEHNCNQIRCYKCRGVGHFARNCMVMPRRRDDAYLQTQLLIAQKEEAGIQLQAKEFDLMAAAADLDEIEEVNVNCILMANLQQASTSGTQTDKALVYDSDGSAEHKAMELEIERLLRVVVSQDIMNVVQNTSVVDTSNLQTELERTKERFENYTFNPLSQKLENENVELEFQVLNYAKENAHLKNTYKNLFDFISLNTKFAKQSILGKTPMLDEIHALSKPVTSNSVPTPQESKVIKNDKVIAPGMFRINPFKTSRVEKNVPNNVRASAKTKPITVSQPYVFTKKDVNSDSNGLSSTGVDNTKTRRPQPRSNTKNDRVSSASKSSRSKNKGVEVEEYHRNLMLSKNTKLMSSACNNIKLDSQNVISKVVCAMCKQCLISVNHDVCLRNYVNGKTSHGNLKLLINFIWKFLRTVRFKNDYVAAILGFGDLQWGNILITRVYFVEGLGHNLFSVGHICDSDLEVAFRRNACFVRNLDGVDLLKGDRSTNLYTINLHDMASASPICLMARASSTKSWLWHQRLSHLNFDTINDLARNDLVSDLCGPMRIASINGKRYVLVIMDDYSRYTWSPVIIIRTDNGIEFKNQVLKEYFDSVGISHQMSSVRTPQQNRVVERRNMTLVEAARTMLIFSRAPLFLWAKAIATACFTQNRSIIHPRFNKTPYELINGKKTDISFLHVFGALCYPKNDREDIGKLGAKG
nr:retrovirus-related Pol polyprotein from transposon TNT 1-94 [Tanacetum cinerariifolium]